MANGFNAFQPQNRPPIFQPGGQFTSPGGVPFESRPLNEFRGFRGDVTQNMDETGQNRFQAGRDVFQQQYIDPIYEQRAETIREQQERADLLDLTDPFTQFTRDPENLLVAPPSGLAPRDTSGFEIQQGDISGLLDQLGGMSADRTRAVDQAVSPLGARYGGIEDQLISQLQGMSDIGGAGTQLGSATADILQQIQLAETPLEAQIAQNQLAALRGELTAPDSEFLQRSVAARQPYLEDTLRAVNEAAGANYGIGGGAWQKQLGDVADQFNLQTLADIAQMQQTTAGQAPQYALGRRGQDVSLTGIGAGLGGQAGSTALGATGQIGQQIRGGAQIGQAADELAFQQEQFDFTKQRDILDRMQEQQRFEQPLELTERQAQFGSGLQSASEQFGQNMDLAQMLQARYGEPSRVEQGISDVLDLGQSLYTTGILDVVAPQIADLYGAGWNYERGRRPSQYLPENIMALGQGLDTARGIGRDIVQGFMR